MVRFSFIGKQLQHFSSSFGLKLACFSRSTWCIATYFYRFILIKANPFCLNLSYFISLSFFGFFLLKALKPRTTHEEAFIPRDLDLFFTSVSAATVSSMSTVEMEVFSNSQLIILTVLMFIGGEVFTSMVGLHFGKSNQLKRTDERVAQTPEKETIININHPSAPPPPPAAAGCVRVLVNVILGYLVVVHVVGISLITVYITLVSGARNVLETKKLNKFTFSIFTAVSTFASCGFVPTNENMIVFSRNSGLLLILIPLVLIGNTLFPSCLRFSLWFLGKYCFRGKKSEFEYLLNGGGGEIGYLHLLPRLHCWFLVPTVLGFVVLQLTLFCSMEWDSVGLGGLNFWEKIIRVLFQTVNSRHTGETIVDLSVISPAILVLFVVMMYLPPYTCFLPLKKGDEMHPRKKTRGIVMENLIFSQLSYLVIFVILICITERQKLKEDPRNFSVLNIVVEVISAYGNVGFTTGYSCERQLKPESNCRNRWYGFSGKWSDEGKIVLIAVMFFGRLKKFNMDGGRAWILL